MDVVVITGSSGLIGSALIKALAGRYRLVGFDRAGPPYPPPEAECVSVDLGSEEDVRTALDGVRTRYGNRIASVVHLAAYYDFSGAESPLYRTITVEGTERLLRNLQSFEVEQFLFSSTMLVHAPSVRPIDETSPLVASWPYPASKIETEARIRAGRGSIPALLLRIAGVYDDGGHSIPITNQIRRIAERQLASRFYPGDLSRGQSFVHLDDLVDAMTRAIDRRATLPPETALLVGEPETLGYGELQAAIGSLVHGTPWRTMRIPKFVARIGARLGLGGEFIKPWMIDRADDHYALDISRARTLLGWEPRHQLRDTLPAIIARLRADPLRWYRENKLGEPPRRLATRVALARALARPR